MVVRYYEFAMGRQLHKIKIKIWETVECWMVDKKQLQRNIRINELLHFIGNGWPNETTDIIQDLNTTLLLNFFNKYAGQKVPAWRKRSLRFER